MLRLLFEQSLRAIKSPHPHRNRARRFQIETRMYESLASVAYDVRKLLHTFIGKLSNLEFLNLTYTKYLN